MIARTLEPIFRQKLKESKLIVLRGPRNSGRKSLLYAVIDAENPSVIVLDCSQKSVHQSVVSPESFAEKVHNKRVLILEEAQFLPNVQEIVEFCFDSEHLETVVLVCSFEPALQLDLWEALRSQGLELRLYPLSYLECANAFGVAEEEKNLELRLIYGYYPAIIDSEQFPEQRLTELLESAVFSQLGSNERINKKQQLILLLRHLAFRIGETISYNELGDLCKLDNETVERYIELFEKADILFTIHAFSTGLRYELKKSHVVYFVDNGIRNALIRAFQPIEFRNDIPALWQNWTISERRKANAYANRSPQTFFWKTHTKQAMDYIEMNDEVHSAFKMSWEKRKLIKIPASFSDAYPLFKSSVVNRSTFWSFLIKK